LWFSAATTRRTAPAPPASHHITHETAAIPPGIAAVLRCSRSSQAARRDAPAPPPTRGLLRPSRRPFRGSSGGDPQGPRIPVSRGTVPGFTPVRGPGADAESAGKTFPRARLIPAEVSGNRRGDENTRNPTVDEGFRVLMPAGATGLEPATPGLPSPATRRHRRTPIARNLCPCRGFSVMARTSVATRCQRLPPADAAKLVRTWSETVGAAPPIGAHGGSQRLPNSTPRALRLRIRRAGAAVGARAVGARARPLPVGRDSDGAPAVPRRSL
jgi:hypothetical protein